MVGTSAVRRHDSSASARSGTPDKALNSAKLFEPGLREQRRRDLIVEDYRLEEGPVAELPLPLKGESPDRHVEKDPPEIQCDRRRREGRGPHASTKRVASATERGQCAPGKAQQAEPVQRRVQPLQTPRDQCPGFGPHEHPASGQRQQRHDTHGHAKIAEFPISEKEQAQRCGHRQPDVTTTLARPLVPRRGDAQFEQEQQASQVGECVVGARGRRLGSAEGTVKRRDRHVPKVRMEVHVAFPDTEACFKLATRSAGVATARHQGLPRVRRRVELPGQRHSHERHGCDHEHARNDEPPAAAWSGRSTQHQQRKADDDGRLDARSMEDGLLPEDTRGDNPPGAVEH